MLLESYSKPYHSFFARAYLALGREALEGGRVLGIHLILTDPLIAVQLAGRVHNRKRPDTVENVIHVYM